jgi:hypothetical protein
VIVTVISKQFVKYIEHTQVVLAVFTAEQKLKIREKASAINCVSPQDGTVTILLCMRVY